MLKRTSVHLRKEDLEYITILSDTLEAPRNYLVRRLLEKAIELHRQGKLELP